MNNITTTLTNLTNVTTITFEVEKIIIENNWIGPIKSDILITKQKCFIIEMSPRFHGEIDTAIIFSLSGLSIPDMFFYSLANSNKNSWKNKMTSKKELKK